MQQQKGHVAACPSQRRLGARLAAPLSCEARTGTASAAGLVRTSRRTSGSRASSESRGPPLVLLRPAGRGRKAADAGAGRSR